MKFIRRTEADTWMILFGRSSTPKDDLSLQCNDSPITGFVRHITHTFSVLRRYCRGSLSHHMWMITFLSNSHNRSRGVIQYIRMFWPVGLPSSAEQLLFSLFCAVCLAKPVMGEMLHWSDNLKWQVIRWHPWSSKKNHPTG